MKMTFIFLGVFILAMLAVIAWCGFPWTLHERVVNPEVVHLEPAGLVNYDEFPSVIKIQTWNLGYLYGVGSEGAGYEPHDKKFYEDKLSLLVNEIKNSDADIVFLQEVDFDSHRSAGINQAQFLADRALFPYVAEAVSWESNYVPFPYWPFGRHFGRMKSGGAILSKYPIVSHEVVLLKKPQSQPWWYNIFYPHRYFQTVEIEIGEKKFRMTNLHLEAFDKIDRKSQVEQLVKKIQKDRIQIVAGDFNMLPTSAMKRSKFPNSKDDYENDSSYDVMLTSGLNEVIPESIYALDEARYFTFPSTRPNRRLDYIFYEKGLKMIKAEVLPSALSDHLPLRASIQIANPKFNPYSQ